MEAAVYSRSNGHGCPICARQSIVHNAKKIVIEGVIYPSLSEAAKAYSLHRGTIKSRLKMGWNINEAFGLSERPKRTAWNAIQLELEGVIYKSRSQAAEAYGIQVKIVESRLKNGWSLDEAFGLKFRKI